MRLLALIFQCDCGQMLALTHQHDGSECPKCNTTLIKNIVEGPNKLAIFLNLQKYKITHQWKRLWKKPSEIGVELKQIMELW